MRQEKEAITRFRSGLELGLGDVCMRLVCLCLLVLCCSLTEGHIAFAKTASGSGGGVRVS